MGLGCRATSLLLPPCVHVAREGPSPKAYVSSSLALPWPVPGPVCPPWCDDAMSGPDPIVSACLMVTLSANSPLAAIRFGGAGELEVAIVGLVVDLPYGLVPPLPLPPPPFPEGGVGWVVVAWCQSLAVGRGAPLGARSPLPLGGGGCSPPPLLACFVFAGKVSPNSPRGTGRLSPPPQWLPEGP